MRARILKPGFFKNDRLAECQPIARILFAGLWCLADRRGILEDRPKRIKAEVLPYDEVDCEVLLAELEARGFILRYQAKGFACIKIRNFQRHQAPHHRERPSDLPDPGEVEQSPGPASGQPSTSPVLAQGQPQASLRPAQGKPDTSPPVSVSVSVFDSNGVKRGGDLAPSATSAPANPSPPPLPLSNPENQATQPQPGKRKRAPDCKRILTLWATHCSHLPQPLKWTQKRQEMWRAKCRIPEFVERLDEIVRRVGQSRFLAGANPRGWKADIDWLLGRADAWVKVLEGTYDDRMPGETEDADEAAKIRRQIARLESLLERDTLGEDTKADILADIDELRRRLKEVTG